MRVDSVVVFAMLVTLALGCSTQTSPPAERSASGPPDQNGQQDGPTADDLKVVEPSAASVGSRKFRFYYDVAIDGLKPGDRARVWLPKAESSHDQTVLEAKLIAPGEAEETTEARFGNRLFYFEATADEQGQIPVLVEYRVERREVGLENAERIGGESPAVFLGGSQLVPADGRILKEVFAEHVPNFDSPLAVARALYDKVGERMSYAKPADKAWGRGDAFYACREGVGNCTDFHSMFIALARDMKVPAKFEIGFPLPPRNVATAGDIGGYHCWAKFAAEGRWIGVDISEADKHPELKSYYFGNLTPDRVSFTTGRDLKLVPKNALGPVNFLVYPYVEVDGKQHTGLKKRFRFQDVP